MVSAKYQIPVHRPHIEHVGVRYLKPSEIHIPTLSACALIGAFGKDGMTSPGVKNDLPARK